MPALDFDIVEWLGVLASWSVFNVVQLCSVHASASPVDFIAVIAMHLQMLWRPAPCPSLLDFTPTPLQGDVGSGNVLEYILMRSHKYELNEWFEHVWESISHAFPGIKMAHGPC